MNTKGQINIFGVIAFLIVFIILFATVFAPFGNVASDVSIGSVQGTGIVAFMVNYWSLILFFGFIVSFGWKIFAG